LHEPGVRLRRLRHRRLKAKAGEQVAFVAEPEESLVAWPGDAELPFVDEATVPRHPTLTAQRCLVDEASNMATGDDHPKVHVYRAMTPLTGCTRYHISPELGNEEFAQFLQHLLTCYPGKRLLVIHDRGAQHKGVCEQIEAIRNFFRYLAGVKNQVVQL
jgi:hypothetical protein